MWSAYATHLIEAADLIEHVGLHKGDYWPGRADQKPYEPGMPCCSMGAIAVASNATLPGGEFRPEDVIPAAAYLAWYINRDLPVALARWLHDWNDEQGQTAEAVATAMRATAAELQKLPA